MANHDVQSTGSFVSLMVHHPRFIATNKFTAAGEQLADAQARRLKRRIGYHWSRVADHKQQNMKRHEQLVDQ